MLILDESNSEPCLTHKAEGYDLWMIYTALHRQDVEQCGRSRGVTRKSSDRAQERSTKKVDGTAIFLLRCDIKPGEPSTCCLLRVPSARQRHVCLETGQACCEGVKCDAWVCQVACGIAWFGARCEAEPWHGMVRSRLPHQPPTSWSAKTLFSRVGFGVHKAPERACATMAIFLRRRQAQLSKR
jgi:hypothetical protein